jgi:uncharacterized alkaline shock family protein YloU
MAAETTSSAQQSPREEKSGTGRAVERANGSPLQTERGQTTIADAVVTKVANIATSEVPGVHALGGGGTRALSAVTQRVGIGDERSQGVSVEVGEREAAVDVTIVVEYGESIPQVSQRIRDNVVRRIEGITGLSVAEVNVSVVDLHFAGDDEPEPSRVA